MYWYIANAVAVMLVMAVSRTINLFEQTINRFSDYTKKVQVTISGYTFVTTKDQCKYYLEKHYTKSGRIEWIEKLICWGLPAILSYGMAKIIKKLTKRSTSLFDANAKL